MDTNELEKEISQYVSKLEDVEKYSYALTLIQGADAGAHLRSMMNGLLDSFKSELMRCADSDVKFWRGAALAMEQIIIALESSPSELEEVKEQKSELEEELKAVQDGDGDEDEDVEPDWNVSLGKAEF